MEKNAEWRETFDVCPPSLNPRAYYVFQLAKLNSKGVFHRPRTENWPKAFTGIGLPNCGRQWAIKKNLYVAVCECGGKTEANQQQNQQNKLRRGQYVRVVCAAMGQHMLWRAYIREPIDISIRRARQGIFIVTNVALNKKTE